jgi:hypothetical protein
MAVQAVTFMVMAEAVLEMEPMAVVVDLAPLEQAVQELLYQGLMPVL